MRRTPPGLFPSALGLVLAALALALPAVGADPGATARPGNQLARAASPFLRLHGGDPISWQPYGEAAFARAAQLGRPLFVSIGYATCAGCLRMAEESFRDPEVGTALDAGFVAVMVDRETEPDLADAYARIAARMGEPVGYPLHVFLLPDGNPIHVATYMPRRDEPGRPGILTVLASVTRVLGAGAEPLRRRGDSLRSEIARELVASASSGAPERRDLTQQVEALLGASDPEWGGRLAVPKRTADPAIALLLRHHRRSGDARSRDAAIRTLERMAGSPVRGADGGFYEAAEERDWSAPRPDQRLADNALIALAYLEGWQASGRAPLRDATRGVLDFVLRKLRAPSGAFFATLHAGAPDAQVLAGANGLAISALARAGFALGEPRYVKAAQAAARFELDHQRDPHGLLAMVSDGRAGPRAALADYALVIAGLLDLLEADADPGWLSAALSLQAEQDARFADPAGAYFLTQAAPGPGLPRPRHARDGALPSGEAIAAQNLQRLAALTGDRAALARADAILAAFRDELLREPLAHAALGAALDARLDGLHEVVLVLAPDETGPALLETLRRTFVPNRVLLVVRDGAVPAQLVKRARLLADKRALSGQSTAYVCRDHVCAHPARDAETLARQLERATPLAAAGDQRDAAVSP